MRNKNDAAVRNTIKLDLFEDRNRRSDAYLVTDPASDTRQECRALSIHAVPICEVKDFSNMKTKEPKLSPDAIASLATRQWQDYQDGQPGRYFAEPEALLALDDAYAVQMGVADLRCSAGDRVAGYKVGCIGPGVVSQFGMSGPIHARIFHSELRQSGNTLKHSAYANLAIEGEMAVRIGMGGAIEAAFPVIELHHFVFRGMRKSLPELVANNGINAGIVLPDDVVSKSLGDWTASRELSIAINGAMIDAGDLWAMTGGATEAVEWLREDLARFEGSIKPGDLILVGTPLALHPVKPGDHVVVSVDDRAYVECHIA